MYICMYVVIRRPRVHYSRCVCILQLSKDRQRRLHANSNVSHQTRAELSSINSQGVTLIENRQRQETLQIQAVHFFTKQVSIIV